MEHQKSWKKEIKNPAENLLRRVIEDALLVLLIH